MNHSVKLKNLLIVITTTLLLLTLIEWTSKKINDRNLHHKNNTFKRQYEGKDFTSLNECCSYNEIDPLLGWAMSATQLKQKGWTIKNNCIVLEHYIPASKDTFIIFITGGSTSDLGLNPKSWPIFLFDNFKKKKKSIAIYVAAVGAYSSSQELLKLIRDGAGIPIDLHISYNGANEYQNPYYVSPYEQNFFDESLYRTQSASLLPNTIYLINSLKNKNSKKLELKPYPANYASEQWLQNMSTMQALAIGKNYKFLGILQPVVGFGKIVNTKKDPNILNFLDEYKNFYPDALSNLQGKSYLIDFTNIFDNIGEKAFIDDCHIKDEYQYLISDSVFSFITRNGY